MGTHQKGFPNSLLMDNQHVFMWAIRKIIFWVHFLSGAMLTLVMLNKLRCHPHFYYLIPVVDTYSHTEWQTVQLQISWLIQKPTDLNLHCLHRQGIFRTSRTRVYLKTSCKYRIRPNNCTVRLGFSKFFMEGTLKWFVDDALNYRIRTNNRTVRLGFSKLLWKLVLNYVFTYYK